MFFNPTEAKKAIEAGGAQADIGDIEKDMNQVSLGKSIEDEGLDRTVIDLAETVGQNGRLSSSYNFFSIFDL